MSAPKTWFLVEQGIPQIDANVKDLIMVGTDPSEVWVCKRHGPKKALRLLDKYRSSLRQFGPDDHEEDVLPSPVSERIKADSDLAALFELIYSAGGRMPKA